MDQTHAYRVRGIDWWIWATLINALLIYNIHWLNTIGGFNTPTIARDLSLVHENNIGVWWAGFVLIMAGLLFFRMASFVGTGVLDRIMWIILAFTIFALSIDETGSLHERVALFGGWWALLPFGVILGAGFLFAIARCMSMPECRVTGVLVMLSLFMFLGVGAMEYLSDIGKLRNTFVDRYRHAVEEGMEQVSGLVLVLAGVVALRARLRVPFRDVSVVSDPLSLWGVREFLFAGLLLHLCVSVLWMPYLWDLGRGSPLYWYPLLVFVLLAFHCTHRFSAGDGAGWLIGIVVFLAVSMGQMQNLGTLAVKLLGINPDVFPDSLMGLILLTTVPTTLFLAFYSPRRRFIEHLLLTLGLIVLVRNGARHFETYYIVSGVHALLCFRCLLGMERSSSSAADTAADRTA
jgi:hypothetical protein